MKTTGRMAAFLDRPFVRGTRRAVRLLLLASAVILAVTLVTTLSIDLGALVPRVKAEAEKRGSKFLDRRMTIGRLSFRLYTGNFLIEDLRIDGLEAESRPFLTAKRITVSIPWTTLFDKRFVLRSIEMTDWKMYVESVKGGGHSLPRLTPQGSTGGRSGWTTTLEWVRAHRGEFTYEDHVAPWSVITRNLDVTVAAGDGGQS